MPPISEPVRAMPGEPVEFNVEFTAGECEMALAYLWLDFGTTEERGIGYSDLILASMDGREARPLRFHWVPREEDAGCHTVTVVIGEEANFDHVSNKPIDAGEVDTAVWRMQLGDAACGDAGTD